jgi:hypothetical protein
VVVASVVVAFGRRRHRVSGEPADRARESRMKRLREAHTEGVDTPRFR